MTDERRVNGDLILLELRHIREDVSKLDGRMGGVESAINAVAVQSNRIDSIVLTMGNVENRIAVHESDIKELARFQASCPRNIFEKEMDEVKESIATAVKGQWAAIAILASALVATGLWKGAS